MNYKIATGLVLAITGACIAGREVYKSHLRSVLKDDFYITTKPDWPIRDLKGILDIAKEHAPEILEIANGNAI